MFSASTSPLSGSIVQNSDVANAAGVGGGTCRCLAALWTLFTLLGVIIFREGVLWALLALGTRAFPTRRAAAQPVWCERLGRDLNRSAVKVIAFEAMLLIDDCSRTILLYHAAVEQICDFTRMSERGVPKVQRHKMFRGLLHDILSETDLWVTSETHSLPSRR